MQISITEWLDTSAEEYSEKNAIVDSHGMVTFTEYRTKSLAIAREIIDSGIGHQQPVVVFMGKSAKVLVAFLGVAYSRCFYSPIDVDMPESRVNKILEILAPKLVITTRELKEKFKQYSFEGEYLIYEDILPSKNDNDIVTPVSRSILDTDLLYVLFTSGSTGVPKGVGIRHRSVIDYIDWVTSEFGICEEDAFGSQAPFYFDNSILDIYSTLKTGATLYIIPKELFSKPFELLEYLKTNKVNTIFWVPTELIMVAKLKALKKVDMTNVIKRVLFCGEVMPNKELNFWREYLPNAVYSNLYGPTEITDACTFYTIDREFSNDESLPIGKPMPNTEILLLDEENHLITTNQQGKIGELCVKGTCLAVGYYKNPEKTNTAFVQNPLNDRYEEKIYRTGDLASYNEYGELIYNGRKDFQIKHLGHRIELGEIETAASSFETIIRNCCLYDTKHSRIVMFVTSTCEVDREELRNKLAKLVPSYMLPEKIIKLDSMPLNDNGKIDRNKLKEMI
ncbi:amino acid adenylation domain-containing protein [Butyrivibrio sp. FC2001]|uniref:amino acid adenylation domain-containing protein n=1 Tax=Butyrivibrio sp. FC2001 TaxID=1280671 RepID=UPI00040B91FB|nr:amino acid adenylation domain-containing protein [Butyrivibrio sp. FC2001]